MTYRRRLILEPIPALDLGRYRCSVVPGCMELATHFYSSSGRRWEGGCCCFEHRAIAAYDEQVYWESEYLSGSARSA